MNKRSRLRVSSKGKRGPGFLLPGVVFGAALLAAFFVFRDQLLPESAEWPLKPLERVVDRGTIYDRNFRELARTLERVSVYVRPRDLKNSVATALQLSPVLGLTEEELLERFNRDAHQVWLTRDISQGEEAAVTALSLPGIFLARELIRHYPETESAAHLLGFAENNIGLAGIERYYDRLLSQGRVRQEELPFFRLGDQRQTAGAGQHLVLTIDLKIQGLLEDYLADLAKVNDGGRVAAVLMETSSGALVAAAQSPSYDPNTFSQYQKERFSNLFLSPVNLPEGLRRYFFETAMIHESRDGKSPGIPWSLELKDVQSGSQLRLWDTLGLSGSPVLDLPQDEAAAVDSIVRVRTSRGSMKYGMVPTVASPVQILQALGHLVNGGQRMYPHLLGRILEEGRGLEHFYSPVFTDERPAEVVTYGVSQEVCRLLRSQGRSAPLGASLVSFDDLVFQDREQKSSYLRTKMVIGLLPAERPELILLLVLEQPYLDPIIPSGKMHLDPLESVASIVSPILVLQQVRKHLADVMGREETPENNFQLEGAEELETIIGRPVLDLAEQPMPDLYGKSLRQGLRALQDKQIRVVVEGTGRIVGHEPPAGSLLHRGDLVRLILARDQYQDEPDSGSEASGSKQSKGTNRQTQDR